MRPEGLIVYRVMHNRYKVFIWHHVIFTRKFLGKENISCTTKIREELLGTFYKSSHSFKIDPLFLVSKT
jgi:hypothetical protein